MASFNIHLAVAKLYAERNGVKDLAAFYKASIDPDLTDEKDITHYGFTPDIAIERDIWQRVVDKVDLAKYLKTNNIDNDYNLGYFLHLIVDLKWFHEFFGKEYLAGTDTDIFSTNQYYSYGLINQHLVDRYGLDAINIEKIADFSFMNKKVQQAQSLINKTKHCSNHAPECIIDIAKLDNFIVRVASLDLENIAKHARIF